MLGSKRWTSLPSAAKGWDCEGWARDAKARDRDRDERFVGHERYFHRDVKLK